MGSDLLLTLGTLTLGGAAAVTVFALTARLSRARYAARWRCWIWALIAHLRFVRYVRRWSRPVEHGGVLAQYARLGGEMKLRRLPRLRMCPGLRAPMLAGLISPALLLPAESLNDDAQTTRCVLVHELTHYKRRDIWLKTLALCANVVHWFNPFMWYMIRLMERDTELACDEAALRRLPPEDHPAYGRAILDAAARTAGKK